LKQELIVISLRICSIFALTFTLNFTLIFCFDSGRGNKNRLLLTSYESKILPKKWMKEQIKSRKTADENRSGNE